MTLEEVKKAFLENEELRKGIISIIPEHEDGKTFLKNHGESYLSEKLNPKIAEIYNGIDNDIKTSLGLDKPQGVKTYDFLKEQLSEFKSLKDSGVILDDKQKKQFEDLKSENEKLKSESGKEGFWMDKHKELQTQTELERNEFLKKIKGFETSQNESIIRQELSKGREGLKFNPNIPEVAINSTIKALEDEIISNAKVVDGKVIYNQKDGNPWLDTNDLNKPINAQGIFATQMKDFIQSSATPGGKAPEGGNGIVTVGKGESSRKEVHLNMADVKTRLDFENQFEKVALENGIERGSKEYNELKTGAYTENNVKELPRS